MVLRYWREIMLVLLAVSLYQVWSIYSERVEDRDATIVTLSAEAKLSELQQDALRQAIVDLNYAVEAQRIDAEKRAAQFEEKSKEIWKRYEAKRKEVAALSGNDECQAMRSMVQEAVR